MNAHAEYETPPNRAIHTWTLCGGIYISQRAFTAFLFWIGWNFAGFLLAKTSANKRFYNMSATLRWWCTDIPGAGSRCKYTTFFWYDQIKMPFMQISHKWHYVLLLITLAWIYYFLIIFSAIWTALRAAPLRIWSPTHQKVIPFSFAKSLRIRPTYTSSVPLKYNGIG